MCLHSGYRENYFIVGLTNNTPATMSPRTYGYSLCGQWPGVAPDGATMFVGCARNVTAARYVIILKYTSGNLNIAEVEVYAKAGKLSRLLV